MSTKTHTLLSELHRLLGTYTAEDFRNTARYPGLSKPLRDALEALAVEAEPEVTFGRPVSRLSKNSHTATYRQEHDSSGRGVTNSKSELFDLIRRSRHFEDNRSLVNFATSSGISLRVAPKESKERLARRLAGTISVLPNARRAQVLKELMADAKSQTQGWMDVIRGTTS